MVGPLSQDRSGMAAPLDSLKVDLTVVFGRARLPLERLLQFGRGAVIPLDPFEGESVEILANGMPVARGRVAVRDGAITVEVLDLVRKATFRTDAGTTIGDGSGLAGAFAPEPALAA